MRGIVMHTACDVRIEEREDPAGQAGRCARR